MTSRSCSLPGGSVRSGRDAAREPLQLILELLGNIVEILWLRDLKQECLPCVRPAFAVGGVEDIPGQRSR
jgi:hypothetical protein